MQDWIYWVGWIMGKKIIVCKVGAKNAQVETVRICYQLVTKWNLLVTPLYSIQAHPDGNKPVTKGIIGYPSRNGSYHKKQALL